MRATCKERNSTSHGIVRIYRGISVDVDGKQSACNTGNSHFQCSRVQPSNVIVRQVLETTSEMGSLEEYGWSQCEALNPSDVDAYLCGLQKFKKSKNSESAQCIYENACSCGLDFHSSIGNYIVQMLAECGCISIAEQVLKRLDYQNEHSWTALILGCIDYDQSHRVFEIYKRMRQKGISPSVYTFMALLKACARLKDVGRGKEVHAEIVQNPGVRDLYIDNALIDMYVKCGSLSKAREVFDQLLVRDVVSWTALISGYAEHGPEQQALECFHKMKEEGVPPNDFTLVCVLKACGSVGAIAKGREIGRDVLEKRLQSNTFLGNSLVDMYAKCGALLEAREVFDELIVRNVVSWNVLIAGYTEHGDVNQALKCFEQMQAEGISPDGMSWTSLIAGFAEYGPGQEALKFFDRMRRAGILPDAVAFASVLKACSNVGAIDKGRELHTEIIEKDYDDDLFISNNLIEMYSQSGTLAEVYKVFSNLSKHDIYVWNSMIKACALNLDGKMAERCFEDMQKQEVKPDIVTFTCLLTVCSHARMVEKGKAYFVLMRDHYGLTPTIDHYTAIVDVLARSGRVYEAENFLLKDVPQSLYDEGMWAALLTACKTYGEVEVGERCFEQLIEMNPDIAPPYVLMADIYRSVGRLDKANKIEDLRKRRGVEKRLAVSTVEVEEVGESLGGGGARKQISEVQENLRVRPEMPEHVPNVARIVAAVPNKKESLQDKHSENIVVAFGVANTQPVTTYANMCKDSIHGDKSLSQIKRSEIISNVFSFVYSFWV